MHWAHRSTLRLVLLAGIAGAIGLALAVSATGLAGKLAPESIDHPAPVAAPTKGTAEASASFRAAAEPANVTSVTSLTPYRPQPRRPISRPLPWQRVPTGFVARRGIGLVLDGQPFTFTGMNIYNANSTGDCWHSMAGGQGLKRALRDIGGGQEVFRAWFFQSLATDRGKRDWRAFDRTLRLAKARGQKVIVVFADQWSACERPSRRWASFYASGYRKQVDPGTTRTYRRYVAEVVKRYRDDPTVLMWQLVNEAETARRNGTCAPASVLRDFAADMSSLIKQIDRHHLVSLGTIGGQQCGMRGSGYRAIHAVPGIDVCEVHDYSAPSVGLPRDRRLRDRSPDP